MQLDLSHQVSLNLELLCLELGLEYRYLLLLAHKVLLNLAPEASHLNLNLFHPRGSHNDLRQRVPHLALDGKLVCPHLVVATNDLLRALNELVLKYVETLLKLVEA